MEVLLEKSTPTNATLTVKLAKTILLDIAHQCKHYTPPSLYLTSAIIFEAIDRRDPEAQAPDFYAQWIRFERAHLLGRLPPRLREERYHGAANRFPVAQALVRAARLPFDSSFEEGSILAGKITGVFRRSDAEFDSFRLLLDPLVVLANSPSEPLYRKFIHHLIKLSLSSCSCLQDLD